MNPYESPQSGQDKQKESWWNRKHNLSVRDRFRLAALLIAITILAMELLLHFLEI